MAKNTGRGTRLGISDGTFHRAKSLGGAFHINPYRVPWKCKMGFHTMRNLSSGSRDRYCVRCPYSDKKAR